MITPTHQLTTDEHISILTTIKHMAHYDHAQHTIDELRQCLHDIDVYTTIIINTLRGQHDAYVDEDKHVHINTQTHKPMA